jgi:NADH:ubiquinone oxidoreductase subunit
MTGTAQAYRPPGSALGKAQRLPSTGDYEAWTPK